MVQCLRGCETLSRVASKQLVQEITRFRTDPVGIVVNNRKKRKSRRYERLIRLLKPSGVHIESFDAITTRKCVIVWPTMLVRGAAKPPNLVQLVKIRRSWENRSTPEHFSQNTSRENQLASRCLSLGEIQIVEITNPIPHISTSPPY